MIPVMGCGNHILEQPETKVLGDMMAMRRPAGVCGE